MPQKPPNPENKTKYSYGLEKKYTYGLETGRPKFRFIQNNGSGKKVKIIVKFPKIKIQQILYH